jgi:hypothetical protein
MKTGSTLHISDCNPRWKQNVVVAVPKFSEPRIYSSRIGFKINLLLMAEALVGLANIIRNN